MKFEIITMDILAQLYLLKKKKKKKKTQKGDPASHQVLTHHGSVTGVSR